MKPTEEQLNRESFNSDKRVDELLNKEAKIYFELGDEFCKIEQLGWQRQGEHILSYKDYAREKKIEPHFIYGSMRVNRTFRDFRGEKLPAYRKLLQALPLAKDKKSAKEWFDKAVNMLSKDFYDELRTSKGKPSQDDCEHQWVNLKKCKKCKKVVYDEKH